MLKLIVISIFLCSCFYFPYSGVKPVEKGNLKPSISIGSSLPIENIDNYINVFDFNLILRYGINSSSDLGFGFYPIGIIVDYKRVLFSFLYNDYDKFYFVGDLGANYSYDYFSGDNVPPKFGVYPSIEFGIEHLSVGVRYNYGYFNDIYEKSKLEFDKRKYGLFINGSIGDENKIISHLEYYKGHNFYLGLAFQWNLYFFR